MNQPAPKIPSYHTHTYRCKHASGDVIDYARIAAKQGHHTLGISDHAALPDNRWLEARMPFDQLDNYEAAIEDARQALPELRILKGMECEYDRSYHHYFQDELLGKRAYDYLIGAGHYTPIEGDWINSFDSLNNAKNLIAYSTYLGKMMSTGLFAFIAHPDLFGCSNDQWTPELTACAKDIFQAAAATKTPLEINGYGFRKPFKQTPEGLRMRYPWKPFWDLACDYDITVICNADAHRPQDVSANMDDARAWADERGLRVVEELSKGSKA